MRYILFLFLTIFAFNNANSAVANAPLEFLQPYNLLLKDFVKNVEIEGIKTSAVDYKSWQKDKRHLQAIMALRNADLSKLKTKEEKLSFWINTYNLLTIDLILQEKEQSSIKNLGSLFQNAWKKFTWKIGNKELNLDTIENKILRPMGEPKIHFAINCASLSCPNLLNEVYWFDSRLNTQLENQAKSFINNQTKGVFNEGGGHLKVSSIFKWYKEDFAKSGGVIKFLQQYNNTIPRHSHIHYLPYNWNLNAIPNRQPIK